MINILTADELKEKTSKGTITTIYGAADAGKSTFMITVAEKMKVLYIDSEGKFGKICSNAPDFEKYKDNISGCEVRTLKDLIGVVSDPMISNFDAVVIDSVTNMVDKELHNIMFTEKRRRTFDDYNDLGTNFMGAIEILREKGISVFFTIQAKASEDGYSQPDAQGGLVAKKAIEVSDWMFYIEESDDGRILSIKNNINCRLKKKGVPEDYPDQLKKGDVKFSTLWDIYPSKPTAKKKVTKAEIAKFEKTAKDLKKIYPKLDMVQFMQQINPNAKNASELSKEEIALAQDLLEQKTKALNKNAKK